MLKNPSVETEPVEEETEFVDVVTESVDEEIDPTEEEVDYSEWEDEEPEEERETTKEPEPAIEQQTPHPYQPSIYTGILIMVLLWHTLHENPYLFVNGSETLHHQHPQ
ncbi:unnamed protein product [Lactuca virosa]|uniref:Uncharacterized protein n=1 Tax=Lactuca virosa TaxID=75947 RepID=A0AAU9MVU5_9ASTR|nr:unnamed protein product [Lactuca virosa]